MIRKFLMVPILLSAFVLIGSGSSAADKAEVVVFPLLQEKSPLISFRVIWFTGAKEDPAGKKGLSALCAATVANGGTTELSREEVLGKLYPMAAEISHQTDKEMVVFTGSVHRDLLDDFYSVFSSLLLRPRFDPADFKREKEGLLNYLKNNLRGTADEQLGKEILDLEVHRGHPYGSCNQGKISDLENISLGDVKEYWRDSFVRSRIQWGIAGDFPESLLKSIQRDFGILPGGMRPGKILPKPTIGKGLEVILVKKPASFVAISIGFPIGITRTDADFLPMMVANANFGDHRTFVGRLMKNMRVKRGLNYGDYSYLENFIEGHGRFRIPNIPRRHQFFSIWIRPVKPEHALFALKQAICELKNFVDNGMTKEEVEEYKKYVVNNAPLWVETGDQRLGYLLDSEFYGIGDFIGKVQKELPKVTTDQVNRAIKKHLQYENLKIVMIAQNAEELKEAFAKNARATITYQRKNVPADILAEDKGIGQFPLEVSSVKVIDAKTLFE